MEKSDGNTPDNDANKKWHYNLYIPSSKSLLKLVNALLGDPRKAFKNDVKLYLQEGLNSNWLSSINRRLSIDLGIIKSGDCPQCSKPLGNCRHCNKPIEIK